METCYTTNSILKYLYRETSLTQTLEIENSIENNEETKELFNSLKAGYKSLPKVAFFPKDETMSNILSYSSKMLAISGN